jgi:hypothetical protein
VPDITSCCIYTDDVQLAMEMNMSENIEQESLSVGEAAKELWDKFSTSQKITVVREEQIAADKLRREIFAAIQDIRRMEVERVEKDVKWTEAAKRSVKQFFKLIGWID